MWVVGCTAHTLPFDVVSGRFGANVHRRELRCYLVITRHIYTRIWRRAVHSAGYRHPLHWRTWPRETKELVLARYTRPHKTGVLGKLVCHGMCASICHAVAKKSVFMWRHTHEIGRYFVVQPRFNVEAILPLYIAVIPSLAAKPPFTWTMQRMTTKLCKTYLNR